MAENRRGLGRGISALLDEASAEAVIDAEVAASQASRQGQQTLPIEQIRRNPDQPRAVPKAEADGDQGMAAEAARLCSTP